MANFFPRWTNWLPLKLAICGIVIVCGLTAATWYYVTPKYTQGRIRADPAGAVSARYSRVAAGDGLPVLPQLRGSGRAFERARTPQTCMNCHHAGAKG